MRNIPVFTTEFGVASLILKEIPYSQTAYIKIQSSLNPEKLLQECEAFCRAAGAERIYASGHVFLAKYPLLTEVWKMEMLRCDLTDTDAVAVPVTDDTLEQWRGIYNDRMSGVDNAAYMSEMDAKQMLRNGNGYFVWKEDALIGILMASEGKLEALASIRPGYGKHGVFALKKLLVGDSVSLEVASTNTRAIKLYEAVGFIKTEVISCWYKII